MTIQELIDELNRYPTKDMEVRIAVGRHLYPITGVDKVVDIDTNTVSLMLIGLDKR